MQKNFYALALFAARVDGSRIDCFLRAAMTSAVSAEEAESNWSVFLIDLLPPADGWRSHSVHAELFFEARPGEASAEEVEDLLITDDPFSRGEEDEQEDGGAGGIRFIM